MPNHTSRQRTPKRLSDFINKSLDGWPIGIVGTFAKTHKDATVLQMVKADSKVWSVERFSEWLNTNNLKTKITEANNDTVELAESKSTRVIGEEFTTLKVGKVNSRLTGKLIKEITLDHLKELARVFNDRKEADPVIIDWQHGSNKMVDPEVGSSLGRVIGMRVDGDSLVILPEYNKKGAKIVDDADGDMWSSPEFTLNPVYSRKGGKQVGSAQMLAVTLTPRPQQTSDVVSAVRLSEFANEDLLNIAFKEEKEVAIAEAVEPEEEDMTPEQIAELEAERDAAIEKAAFLQADLEKTNAAYNALLQQLPEDDSEEAPVEEPVAIEDVIEDIIEELPIEEDAVPEEEPVEEVNADAEAEDKPSEDVPEEDSKEIPAEEAADEPASDDDEDEKDDEDEDKVEEMTEILPETVSLSEFNLVKTALNGEIVSLTEKNVTLTEENVELKTMNTELSEKAYDATKEAALDGLLNTGRMSPSEKDQVSKVYDIEMKQPELGVNLFSEMYASREANSIVPLGTVGTKELEGTMTPKEALARIKELKEEKLLELSEVSPETAERLRTNVTELTQLLVKDNAELYKLAGFNFRST